jgi:hypothetical protein
MPQAGFDTANSNNNIAARRVRDLILASTEITQALRRHSPSQPEAE